MPVAKIHVLKGQYNEARLGKVSSAVQDGLISALGIPPEDFLEITFISGRPKEKRLALLKALNEGVAAAAGISPDDLLITLYETPGENISFGRGLAQRAHISEKDSKAA